MAPTLVPAGTSLPPRGRYSRLGAALRREMAPTLVPAGTSLPPRGRYSRLGAALRREMAPTLVPAGTSLPPQGALFAPWGGPAARNGVRDDFR